MINLIKTFPEQLKEALELTKQINASDISKEEIQHIAISGMGGSGIGAHLVKSIVENNCNLPITLIQGYVLPNWVNKQTLFIACSYSGNTEETLSLLRLAEEKTNHIFSVTTGGKLKEISDGKKYPQYNFSGEAKCPRAGLAYPSVAILMLLHKLDFCPGLDIEAELKASINLLEEQQEDIQIEGRSIAKDIYGYFTLLYADQKFFPAVLRFQQQLAENSKQLSHAHVFPELNYNELVGWRFPEEHIKKSKAILLRSDFDHDKNQKRMDISKSIISEKAEVLELEGKGKSFTQQLYYFIHLIDWISFYLAEENQIDPFPVENIDFLKNKLVEL
ncbi:bifunctional phosphoglucose/phosphomannose isomerase [Marivirga salinae]|uniref:Bifunctional phosphoglucose/phosphomannose isomerase n=1 Tax=Marivirga salinarum TaxID=3059078 RepID=A0AA51NCX5_9BACT|nr:bifunctional phosphoglucose/phosphomannose isomerase [Marivirga sp. BDSF4-3]WMN11276.1 bifunctional phosphoglucose/phosphomannose isomerase [Marivirga sp. BDSF4-3]